MKSSVTTHESLRNAYDLLSPFSDKQRWEFDSNLFHLNSVVKKVTKHQKIIDIGCGIGILALSLKIMGYDICGIDRYVFESENSYSADDIEKLKKIWNENNLKIYSGDITESKKLEEFDVAVSIAVIEHQKDIKSFIQGLSSYLRVGGIAYVATPNISNLLNRFRMLFGRAPMANIESLFRDGESFNGHWREFTIDELKKVFILSKVEIIESGNKQTGSFSITKNYKKWHVATLRLFARVIPGAGDTNYIWIKK